MVKIHYHLMVQSYLIHLEMNLKIQCRLNYSEFKAKFKIMVYGKNVHVNYVC